MRLCSFPGCERKYNARGYCSVHYRYAVAGRPLAPLAGVRSTTARDEQGRKECARCLMWLPVDNFGPTDNTRDRLRVWCLVCVQTKKYGLTRQRFEALLTEQGGTCAICDGTSTDGKALHVDHDHACCPTQGRSCGACVRGLLCSECNKAIGLFRDDIQLLARAAVYLSTRSAA